MYNFVGAFLFSPMRKGRRLRICPTALNARRGEGGRGKADVRNIAVLSSDYNMKEIYFQPQLNKLLYCTLFDCSEIHCVQYLVCRRARCSPSSNSARPSWPESLCKVIQMCCLHVTGKQVGLLLVSTFINIYY